MSRSRSWAVACFTAVAVLAIDAPAMGRGEQTVAESPSPAREFAGRYAFIGGDAEREALRNAIDAVVEEVTPLLRRTARRRLTEGNPIPEQISIEVAEKTVTITLDERRYTAALEGAPIEVVGIDGKRLELTHRLEGSRLTQLFDGERGQRWNLFRRRGERLVLTVLVESSSLPADLLYQLTFERR